MVSSTTRIYRLRNYTRFTYNLSLRQPCLVLRIPSGLRTMLGVSSRESCNYLLPLLIIRLGLGVLFGKLQQGVTENEQVLTIARMRAEAEDVYGLRLGEIGAATDKIQGGFSRDDGASVRKVRANECNEEDLADGIDRHMMEFAQKWRRLHGITGELPRASATLL